MIKQFEDAAQGIQVLEASIQSDDYSLEQKRELILLKESIMFLSLNQTVISSYISHTKGKSSVGITKCDWWERWGNCAAATIGGALTGASSGCAGGAAVGAGVTLATGPGLIAGAITGCKIGGFIGAIGGALEGAADSCDGCQT